MDLRSLIGRTASVGGTSGRGADAGLTGGTGAEYREYPSRLLFTALGTFQIAVAVGYFAVGFKFFAAGFTFIFVDGHDSIPLVRPVL